MFYPLLWIRIRKDPELLPGFGSGIIVSDPDPANVFFYNFQIYLTNMSWIRNFYLDLDLELGKFKAGSVTQNS